MTAAVSFGTKAETLARLRPHLARAYVLDVFCFTVARWRSDGGAILQEATARFPGGPLIVRSSARTEDAQNASLAGAYLSVPDVPAGQPGALQDAIQRVVASYGNGVSADDQVLVQPQLQGVRLSGVLFCRDLSTRGPYRIFNYDRSGSTFSVTSGTGSTLETYVRFRDCSAPYPSADLQACFEAAEELEGLLGDRIEMELAVDATGRVCVFQVRPITLGAEPGPTDATVKDWLVKTAKKVEKLGRPHPHLLGEKSVFGVMPDWNPAEIIGLKPRTLALTMYKELVTDSTWAYMRDNYGYRNLRSFPLVVSLLGMPFVDVRVSFNSFIPKSVPEALAARLVNLYVQRLVEAPEKHDKVEFDIVFSCFYPGIQKDMRVLGSAGFQPSEQETLLEALRALTNRVIHPTLGLWREDLARIQTLQLRHGDVLQSPMSAVDKFYWLLEDCKRYGTLPFSGLARAGFMAAQFLRGLQSLGIFSPQDHARFMASLSTITHAMGRDAAALQAGRLSRQVFLERYGHLRPGTYDITSARYDEAFETYFPVALPGVEAPHLADAPFELTSAQRAAVDQVLRADGLEVTVDQFFEFIRSAIEGREHSKLAFTRNLSDAFVQLETVGAQCRITREELSWLNVRTVQQLYSMLDAADLRDVLMRDIDANREASAVTRLVKLPDLIVRPEDVFHFHLGRWAPNFIGHGVVVADVVTEDALSTVDLRGRAVVIRSADPGYDWIFSRGIGALLTQFGGANSHMAIRAAELGIPAVIGGGESNHAIWSRASCLEVDCGHHVVRVIR